MMWRKKLLSLAQTHDHDIERNQAKHEILVGVIPINASEELKLETMIMISDSPELRIQNPCYIFSVSVFTEKEKWTTIDFCLHFEIVELFEIFGH